MISVVRTIIYICGTYLVCGVLMSPALAGGDDVTLKFSQYDNESEYKLTYDDYSALLDAAVLNLGMSDRERVPKSVAPIGTRFKSKVDVYTALEGNRFYFEGYRDNENLHKLTAIRQSLEATPNEVPLDRFNKQEQLAYWLNLYNITLLEELCRESGSDLRQKLTGRDSILDKKLLNVSGVELTLNDIHHKILIPNFGGDPVIMYGLFQGHIGGPNIREDAYVGDNVYKMLRLNAVEFINSNRGMMGQENGSLRVSKFYEMNKALFPDFDRDLRQHLLVFARLGYKNKILKAKLIKSNITNWIKVSLLGDTRTYGGSVSRSREISLALGFNNPVTHISNTQLLIVNKLRDKYYKNKTSVSVEEIDKEELRRLQKED